ncbi:MAG: acyl-CoA thioesterase [Acidimicrobiales bacterium]|jgi:acyl-CoA thioester hydrolase|nr:acyl-CoA thioesterase [Acidimicrobiales bacterium]HLV90645.1 thioesterase family protein [Acidimicrobiia bacterium]
MATVQKIRYSDCDPQGIAFNGNYTRYWDDALTDWLWEAGFTGEHLGVGAEMVTARIEIDFRSSARLGDTVVTTAEVERIGNTSMTVAVTTRRQGDDEVICEGREVIVFVDPDTFRPVPVPDPIREQLG